MSPIEVGFTEVPEGGHTLDTLLAWIRDTSAHVGEGLRPEQDWHPFVFLQVPEPGGILMIDVAANWDTAEGREASSQIVAHAAQRFRADLFAVISTAWVAGDIEALADGREPQELRDDQRLLAETVGIAAIPDKREVVLVEAASRERKRIDMALIERSEGPPQLARWMTMPDAYESRFARIIQPNLASRER